MRRSTFMFSVLLTSASAPALAAGGAWEVGKVTGHAWMQAPDTQPADLAVGATVPEGMTVFTDPRARVMLVRGTESMLVGPKSVMAVGPGAAPGLDTTIVQQVGSVTFEVAKLDHPHFSVETPMLAAVVKGTHFTVSVSASRADVAVARGLVGVTGLATGESADISPGQRAAVSIGHHGGMSVGGPKGATPSISRGQPRAAMVSTVAAAAATEAAKASAAAASGSEAAASAATAATSQAAATASAATSTSAASTSGNGASGGNSDASFRSAQTSMAAAAQAATASTFGTAAPASLTAGIASGLAGTAVAGASTLKSGMAAPMGGNVIGGVSRTVSVGFVSITGAPSLIGTKSQGPAGPAGLAGPGLASPGLATPGLARGPAGLPGAPGPGIPAGPGPVGPGVGFGLGGLVGQIGTTIAGLTGHSLPGAPGGLGGLAGLGKPGRPGGFSLSGALGAARSLASSVHGGAPH